MSALAIHPERIKSEIRIRYGSLAKFERAKGLKERSVTDVLRGKTSRHTAEAIAVELGHSVESLFASANADDSAAIAIAHVQNAGAA